jgi:flagellar basal-body rod modification protein FlgD
MATSAITGTSSSTPTSTTSASDPLGNYDLKASDFMNMMITQLQNQDPTNPTDSSQLLTQISQIGSLQSSTDLQSTLKTLMLQDSLGSAGNLIGKSVSGTNDAGDSVSGSVSSVNVQNNSVYLTLDSGDSLSLSNVSAVTTGNTATAAATAGTPVATK